MYEYITFTMFVHIYHPFSLIKNVDAMSAKTKPNNKTTIYIPH